VNLTQVASELERERSVTFTAHGDSMVPKIRSGDTVTVERFDPERMKLKKGQIVLARVSGRLYLHLISALEGDRVQISNNKKHVNGWTQRSNVLARLTDVQRGKRGKR
jgi:translation initiation factor IF-1